MKMKDLKLGTILENGAEVYGILTLKGDKKTYLKYGVTS